jgi:hypothetical protein
MSGTAIYHGFDPPYRIQKRLVLNQCFRCIRDSGGMPDSITYVTFGGRDLYDVMDLVAVFDLRGHKMNVVSYEEDAEVAGEARLSAVATTLSQMATVSIDIVPSAFFDNSKPLRTHRSTGPFIYFLDDTRTFRERQAATLVELLRARLLRTGDWLLITSCLTPRVVNQERFMTKHDGTFRLFYGQPLALKNDFRVRNHVDLLVALSLSRYVSLSSVTENRAHATLMRKFKYRDTRATMGLWLFRVEAFQGRAVRLEDCVFEEFPVAFEKVPQEPRPDVPNIFD